MRIVEGRLDVRLNMYTCDMHLGVNYKKTCKYESKPRASWHLSEYKGVQVRFDPCISKIGDN